MNRGEADKSLRSEERARGSESISPHSDRGDHWSSSEELSDNDSNAQSPERERVRVRLRHGGRKGGSAQLG
jgi:hypothetical protein